MGTYNKYIILLLVVFFLPGCPESPTEPPTVYGEVDIVFTGLQLGSELPSIMGIDIETGRILELVPEGIFYSRPTSKEEIIFLKDGANEDMIFKYNFVDWKNVPTGAAKLYQIKKYPVFASDEFSATDKISVAFFSYNKDTGEKLILISVDPPDWAQSEPSGKFDFCENTIPAFSPDGKYLAFLEGDSVEAPLKLTVVSSKPLEQITSKELIFGVEGLAGEVLIDWSHKDYIAYAVSGAKNDIIGLFNMNDPKSSYEFEVKKNIGAFNPVVSPNGTQVAFCGRDGNIWLTDITDNPDDAGWYQLTDVSDLEYCLYPQWDNKGERLIYTKYHRNVVHQPFKGSLEIVNVSTLEIEFLCNNVYMAYWRRDKIF